MIKFDSEGLRTNFHLSIIELQSEGLVVVGTWNSIDGANFSRHHLDGSAQIQESLFNKTLIVSSILVKLILLCAVIIRMPIESCG